jgi:hypothetical protein
MARSGSSSRANPRNHDQRPTYKVSAFESSLLQADEAPELGADAVPKPRIQITPAMPMAAQTMSDALIVCEPRTARPVLYFRLSQ